MLCVCVCTYIKYIYVLIYKYIFVILINFLFHKLLARFRRGERKQNAGEIASRKRAHWKMRFIAL